jgi:hypothetical protein
VAHYDEISQTESGRTSLGDTCFCSYGKSLSSSMFMRSTSVEINMRAGSVNHLWSGRYRWSLIESQRHYYQVYRYIYQNPIRAGLVKKVQEYKWNTLGEGIPFPLHSSVPLSFCGEEGELAWLNEQYENEDIELIRLGLRKQYFDLSQRRLKAFNKLSVPPSNT